MKSKQISIIQNGNVLYVSFGDFKREQTYFFLLPWETVVLKTKIVKHGDLGCYLKYLIHSYSQTIYNHYPERKKGIGTGLQKTNHFVRVECNAHSKTLQTLNELACYANTSKTKMFRILLEMDRKGWKPPLQFAA